MKISRFTRILSGLLKCRLNSMRIALDGHLSYPCRRTDAMSVLWVSVLEMPDHSVDGCHVSFRGQHGDALRKQLLQAMSTMLRPYNTVYQHCELVRPAFRKKAITPSSVHDADAVQHCLPTL